MQPNYIDPAKTVAFSGYRPYKITKSNPANKYLFPEIASSLLFTVTDLAEKGYTTFLNGMAEGFDLMAARVVLSVKENFPNIKLIPIIPYRDQALKFSNGWRQEYEDILSRSDGQIILSTSYYSGVFYRRNDFLIDHSSVLVCYYDGQDGGTKYTVELAQRLDREIVNLCTSSNLFTKF